MAVARNGKSVVAVCIVFPILAALAIFARFYARRIKRNPITTDDYLLVVSWCVSTGMAITHIYGAYYGGIGAPLESMNMRQITIFTSILFAGQFLYLFSVGLIKLSIVCFYKRIFNATTFLKAANGILVIIGLWLVAFFFATLFQAWPISHAWTGAGRNLIDYPAMYMALGATDLALDVIILCMPMPMIKSLKISSRRKLVVAAIFGLGFLCVIASAVRINYLRLVNYGLQETVSWGTVQYIIWSQIEACWSIVCACLPTIGPVFKGGRAAESMVNSFRSIFSSQSNESFREKTSETQSNKKSNSIDSESRNKTQVG